MTFLHGPVAFIDDEIRDPEKAAFHMKGAIEADGRPVASYEALPDIADIAHWRSLAFLVVDWDLSPGSFGGQGAATLGDYARSSLFDFLLAVMDRIFCPIFVVSAEDVGDIHRQLLADGRFGSETLDTRIKVFGKSAVATDLLEHLEAWVENNLALSVLKVWEQEYELAKNRLFIDFNHLDPSWPTYVWRNAEQDKVEPSFELAATITANLLHRIDLVKFDTETIVGDETAVLSSSSMRKVFNGRTVIPAARLHENVVMPGDMFFDGDPADNRVVWLNLTPACHTVVGRLEEGEGMELYVIRGERQPFPLSERSFRDWTRESPNKILIHTLVDGSAYLFDFKSARFVQWAEVASLRAGRLLPPYVTRAQQANAMFMQIEGVPRPTFALYKTDPAVPPTA